MTVSTSPRVRMLRDAVGTIRRLCVVPEDDTTTSWADKHRMLPSSSTSPGPFRSDVAPYTRRWMDLGADPSTELMVLCWGTQTLKSTVIENIIGYRIVRMPTPMILLRPQVDDAERWAKQRFTPMVLATPQLRDRVKLGRSTDSTLRYKSFPGGFLFVASAHSATECASWSAPFVAVDECDRMVVIAGEGNPVEIIARRMGAADVGAMLITSTPRDAETTIIWPYLEASTFELYEVPCTQCNERQPLIWKQLQWPNRKPRDAVYICPLCGGVNQEKEKPGMLAAGEWKATNPDGLYPGSHLSALYSPFAKSGWGVIADEWERAQGKPADLQVFVNTRLAELWTETDSKVEASDLEERRHDAMEEGVVPDGVGMLTAGVDVQDNRLEVRVWGWGAGLVSWLVARFILPGDPSREPDAADSVWQDLDRLWLMTFPHVNGQHVPITAALVDSGFRAPQVYRYTDPRRRKRGKLRHLGASKGIPGNDRPILGKPTVQTVRRIPLYPLGVDVAKTEFLRSQILEVEGNPGYVHLPGWAELAELEGLVSEVRKRVIRRGRVTYEWRKKKSDLPNEPLDCRILARGALDLSGPQTILQLEAMAARLSVAAAVSPESAAEKVQDAPRSRPQRNGWVNKWRDG